MPTLSGKWIFNDVVDCSTGYVFDGEYANNIIFVVNSGICYRDNIGTNLSGAKFYHSTVSPENDTLYPFMFSELKIDGYSVEVGKTNVPEVGDYIIDPLGRLFTVDDVYGDTADATIYETLDFVYTVSDGWNKYNYRIIDFGTTGTVVTDKFYSWFTSNAESEIKNKLVTVESLATLHEYNKNTYMTKLNTDGDVIVNSLTIGSNVKLVSTNDSIEIVFLDEETIEEG